MELLDREIKKSVNKAKSPFLGVMCIPTVAIGAKYALFTHSPLDWGFGDWGLGIGDWGFGDWGLGTGA